MSTMQIVFSIIGLLLIALIIGHGMWNIRRSERRKQEQQHELEQKRQRAHDTSGFDDDGIGEVRVIKRASERAQATDKRAAVTAAEAKKNNNDISEQPARGETKPAGEQPIRAWQDDEELDLPSLAAQPDELKKAEQKAKPAPKAAAKAAPKSAAEKSRTDEPKPTQQSMDLALEPGDEPVVSQAPDMVIALHVTGNIEGPVLLQQLTELGFKYGEFDIFHRHVDSAGTGPVLFSLANMFNPGTFDIDAMEQFETKGVALFLALPIKSNSTQAFTMMHNAAEKLAAAVEGGQVLDEHRNPLTRQAVQHIHQSIREYERKRLIRQ
ncbi:cell division protein ZipA [Pseudidiomarina insulisalsae]|uniref:Cell division protein ZipA n=1 Tax=Pseudidiomarina insulisalsae TaxID=575789 RepID=A0A432YI41_9GAMM|nr:cell division protein ZipA [Pseudidiomarina insulisalsae]RUO60590.1 cell division protein ZipA [Pseudidiomarina insulisalsae]